MPKRKIISNIDAIYDELARRYKNGDPNVRKTGGSTYQLLNDSGKVILEVTRF